MYIAIVVISAGKDMCSAKNTTLFYLHLKVEQKRQDDHVFMNTIQVSSRDVYLVPCGYQMRL